VGGGGELGGGEICNNMSTQQASVFENRIALIAGEQVKVRESRDLAVVSRSITWGGGGEVGRVWEEGGGGVVRRGWGEGGGGVGRQGLH